MTPTKIEAGRMAERYLKGRGRRIPRKIKKSATVLRGRRYRDRRPRSWGVLRAPGITQDEVERLVHQLQQRADSRKPIIIVSHSEVRPTFEILKRCRISSMPCLTAEDHLCAARALIIKRLAGAGRGMVDIVLDCLHLEPYQVPGFRFKKGGVQ